MRSAPKPPAFWRLIVETYLLIRMGVTRSVLVLWLLLFSFVTLAVVFGK